MRVRENGIADWRLRQQSWKIMRICPKRKCLAVVEQDGAVVMEVAGLFEGQQTEDSFAQRISRREIRPDQIVSAIDASGNIPRP